MSLWYKETISDHDCITYHHENEYNVKQHSLKHTNCMHIFLGSDFLSILFRIHKTTIHFRYMPAKCRMDARSLNDSWTCMDDAQIKRSCWETLLRYFEASRDVRSTDVSRDANVQLMLAWVVNRPDTVTSLILTQHIEGEYHWAITLVPILYTSNSVGDDGALIPFWLTSVNVNKEAVFGIIMIPSWNREHLSLKLNRVLWCVDQVGDHTRSDTYTVRDYFLITTLGETLVFDAGFKLQWIHCITKETRVSFDTITVTSLPDYQRFFKESEHFVSAILDSLWWIIYIHRVRICCFFLGNLHLWNTRSPSSCIKHTPSLLTQCSEWLFNTN